MLMNRFTVLLLTQFLCCAMLLTCGNRARILNGTVSFVAGQAKVRHPDGDTWQKLTISSKVEFGDSIATAGESEVEISFDGENSIRFTENTKAAITYVDSGDNKNSIEVYNCFGTVFSNIAKLTKKRGYRVVTPTSVASIRGTIFCVSFDINDRASNVSVVAGNVWVRNPHLKTNFILVEPGNFTIIAWGRLPEAPLRMNHGQWKKFERMMRPELFRKHSKSLKFDRSEKPLRVGKMFDNIWKEHKKEIKEEKKEERSENKGFKQQKEQKRHGGKGR